MPVAADVVPQMNLFGEPGDEALQPAPAPLPTPPPMADEPAGSPSVPAFQRRKDLRADRQRLISELARKRRWTHREANVWINGTTGVKRVEDATIDQLQRSCRLLVDELVRSSRARG